jgi:SOS-response transcriptional repressor LexA
MRKFYDKKGKITLKSDDPEIKDIQVNNNDSFYIIGKILMKPKNK